MGNFKSVVKKRLIVFQSLSGFMGLCIIILAVFNQSTHTNAGDFSRGVQIGIFVGIAFVTLYFIGKLRHTLKSEDRLKKLFITENDERRRWVEQKAGSTTIAIVAYSIPLAIIVAGFYNIVVLITLLLTLAFFLTIAGSVKYYYYKKY